MIMRVKVPPDQETTDANQLKFSKEMTEQIKWFSPGRVTDGYLYLELQMPHSIYRRWF